MGVAVGVVLERTVDVEEEAVVGREEGWQAEFKTVAPQTEAKPQAIKQKPSNTSVRAIWTITKVLCAR